METHLCHLSEKEKLSQNNDFLCQINWKISQNIDQISQNDKKPSQNNDIMSYINEKILKILNYLKTDLFSQNIHCISK